MQPRCHLIPVNIDKLGFGGTQQKQYKRQFPAPGHDRNKENVQRYAWCLTHKPYVRHRLITRNDIPEGRVFWELPHPHGNIRTQIEQNVKIAGSD